MSYRRTKAVFIKELHHITRDPRSLALALAMPVMMLLLYGYALSLDVDHIQTVIYDQDGTEASRKLMRQFQGSRFFDVVGFVNDYRAIERSIDDSRVLVGVAIPRDFGKDLATGRGATVQILVDGSDSNTAAIARATPKTWFRTFPPQRASTSKIGWDATPLHRSTLECESGTTARLNRRTTWCRA